MPYINKPKKGSNMRCKPQKRGRSAMVAKIYANPLWRKLRLSYIQQHPLCEDCLDPNIENEDGNKGKKITSATEIHHITPILNGNNELEMMDLAFDENNLRALCEYHHHRTHNTMRKKNEKKF